MEYKEFPDHRWDIGGSGDIDINLTTVQLFGVMLPGGGWNFGSLPILNCDWETEQATIPLNINFRRTVVCDGRPWKWSMEVNC